MFDLNINNFKVRLRNLCSSMDLNSAFHLPGLKEHIYSEFDLAKHKPTKTNALIVLEACFADLTHMFCGSNIDKSDFYLLRQHMLNHHITMTDNKVIQVEEVIY